MLQYHATYIAPTCGLLSTSVPGGQLPAGAVSTSVQLPKYPGAVSNAVVSWNSVSDQPAAVWLMRRLSTVAGLSGWRAMMVLASAYALRCGAQ